MSFDDTQRKELAKPLDPRNVKPPAPGKYGDYVEGWQMIAEANRIFGFDGWTRETVSMIETNRELLTLKTRDGGEYQQWRVGFVAKVRITAGGIVREGTGFGSGMGKPEALGEAIESAAKEAETDAMKRALMTFGNPFGLALYDKTQANVGTVPTGPSLAFQSHAASLNGADSLETLKTAFAAAKADKTISKAEADELIAIKEARKLALGNPALNARLDNLDKSLGPTQ
jgi:DNA repair and recombination protein RAD52